MIPIDEATLAQVSRDVCETMLCLSASQVSTAPLDGIHLAAYVQIRGECELRVEVETVRELASQIASQMFSTEPQNLDESELRDALGEVANMIGGNVKGILSGEFDLSLPIVEERRDNRMTDSSYGPNIRFSCGGFPLIVRVVSTSCVASLA